MQRDSRGGSERFIRERIDLVPSEHGPTLPARSHTDRHVHVTKEPNPPQERRSNRSDVDLVPKGLDEDGWRDSEAHVVRNLRPVPYPPALGVKFASSRGG